jgi:ParB family chromosome partitioning protein
MLNKKKRFGLSSTLSQGLSDAVTMAEADPSNFYSSLLPLSRIEFDPENPRRLQISREEMIQGIKTDDLHYQQKSQELASLEELANTIKSSGLLNPIIVYKSHDKYQVVAGERRCLASILAGKSEIEARIFHEKPKGFELKLIQWIENTAREDLTLADRINNIRDIMSEYELVYGKSKAGLNATALKEITGLSLSQASCYISVLQGPAEVLDLIEQGKLNHLDKAALIVNISSDAVRQEAIHACIDGISLKQLRAFITSNKPQPLKAPAAIKTMKPSRGRLAARVNLGFTHSTQAIKNLTLILLNHESYRHYNDNFKHVDWDNFSHVSTAFQQLIKIVETESKGNLNE